jgi:mannitol/fructose-specific phosphotransferase system IIA component (Ntr-type)
MKILDLIQPGSIVPELAGTDRNAAIRELVEALGAQKLVRPDLVDSIVRSIVTRERTRGTTGFGKGVAVPHAKVEEQTQIVAAVGRSSHGIDFASLDGQPVHIVFLIVSPANQPDDHLRAMDLIFRNVQQERFRKFLRQLDTREKIYDLLKEADEKALVA